MREVLELAAELWADRRRLRLVVFALAWGTLGLTVLAGFGEGFERAMREVLTHSGDRMLRVTGGSTSQPHLGLAAGRIVRLEPDAVDALRTQPGVRRSSVEYTASGRLVAGTAGVSANVRGVEPEYAAIRGLVVAAGGRFVNAVDGAERRRVVVLGERLARELFGARDALGLELRIGSQPYRVVGIVRRVAMVMNYDGDDDRKAFVPASTLRATSNVRWPSYVLLELDEPTQHAAVARQLRRALAPVLRFDPSDDRALGIVDHVAQTDRIAALVVGTRLFLLIVGVLGLCVAAVGIANSTHALVLERRAEIGLRMALGATRRQIVIRPLIEALLLVVVGGGSGLLLGIAVLVGLDALPLDATARGYLGSPVPSPGVAAAVAVLLGLVAALAGLAPARRAASVDPTEALRHE